MKCHPKKEKEAEEVLVEENKIKGKDPKVCTFFVLALSLLEYLQSAEL